MRTLYHFLMALAITSIPAVGADEETATETYQDLEAVRTEKEFDPAKTYRLSTSGVCGVVADDHILVTEVLPDSPADGKILVGDKVRAFQYRGIGGGVESVRQTAGNESRRGQLSAFGLFDPNI